MDGIIKELEMLKTDVAEIKMKKALISGGFECYGFKDKTPDEIRDEIIEIIEERIAELKEEGGN